MTAPAVEIYTRRRCPRCTFVRQLLERNGVAFTEHALEAGPHVHAMMRMRTGSDSVPQVLLGGRALGGCDALHTLERRGELGLLLARAGGTGCATAES